MLVSAVAFGSGGLFVSSPRRLGLAAAGRHPDAIEDELDRCPGPGSSHAAGASPAGPRPAETMGAHRALDPGRDGEHDHPQSDGVRVRVSCPRLEARTALLLHSVAAVDRPRTQPALRMPGCEPGCHGDGAWDPGEWLRTEGPRHAGPPQTRSAPDHGEVARSLLLEALLRGGKA